MKVPQTNCMVKQESCGNMTVFTPPKTVDGAKEYFKDDYFEIQIELIKIDRSCFN